MAFHFTENAQEGKSETTTSETVSQSMRDSFGPQAVDQLMRQAMNICWMLLPKERKTPQELKAELQRILDRAIAGFQEDVKAFGFEAPPST